MHSHLSVSYTYACLHLKQVSCNLALIATLNNFRPVDGVCLTLHSGIGAGQLSGFFVGGVKSEWEFFVAGEPVQQMALAGDEAASGQVVLSRFAHAQVATVAVGKEIASGNFLVVGIAGDAAPTIFKREQHITPSAMEKTLVKFVPRHVRYASDE